MDLQFLCLVRRPQVDLQFLSGNPPGPVPDTSGPLTNSPFYEYVTTGHCSHVCV